MTSIKFFSITKQSCHLIPIEIKPEKFLRIMQGLRSLWSPLLMTLALLCDNKGMSAVCQQKFRTVLPLNYLYGLNFFRSFKMRQFFSKICDKVIIQFCIRFFFPEIFTLDIYFKRNCTVFNILSTKWRADTCVVILSSA